MLLMVTRKHLNTFAKGARVEVSTSTLRWSFRLSNSNYVFNVINSANRASHTKEIGFMDFLLKFHPRRERKSLKQCVSLAVQCDLFSLGNVIPVLHSVKKCSPPSFIIIPNKIWKW